MRLIATRRATSLLKPRVSIDSQYTIRGELVMVCAYAKQDGRGNLRVAKTPPLQSGVCGDIVAFRIALQMPTMASSMRIPCHPWRRAVFTTTRHA